MVLYAFGFIGVPVGSVVPQVWGSMVSVCTLTSLARSSCVLILFSLPEVSLSHCCMHSCYTIVETANRTNKEC